jgi:hypothetical protein
VNNAQESLGALISHGASIDARNQKGETPLVLSFKNGHVDAAKHLLNEARLNVWFFPIAHNKPKSLTAAVAFTISSKKTRRHLRRASTHCWFRAGNLHPQTAAHFIDLGGKCQHMCAWGSASFTHRLLSRRACTRQLGSGHVKRSSRHHSLHEDYNS